MVKKSYLAALAIVAMAGCTKVENGVSVKGESQISFEPAVASQTKVSYVDNAWVKANQATFKFSVFGWYTPGDTFDSTTVNTDAYMNNVPVEYNSTLGASPDLGDDYNGGWAPTTTYYWPKNGNLSFDAYYPTGKVTASATAEEGLKFTGYTVSEDDLLYSERVYDKKSSTGTDGLYAGVDIPFFHALAAVEFSVKADNDYEEALKLNKVSILKAYNTGDFAQNLANGKKQETDARAWTNQSNEVEYVLFNDTTGVNLTTTAFTSKTTTKIDNVFVLPQSFAHGVVIKIEYTVNGLAQENTFELKNNYDSITGWEIGKRYTYNFTIALDQIYFAPSVTDWKDVSVSDITVR